MADNQELTLQSFNAVNKFKSVRRAIRRGLISPMGTIAPKRPFNNRSRTRGRKFQLLKESIYADIISRHT